MNLKWKYILPPKQLLEKLSLILALLVLLPMLALTIYRHTHHIGLIEELTRKELLHIAILLEKKMPDSFDELRAQLGVVDEPAPVQVMALNRELQPLLADITALDPHLGVGVYSIELDYVLAIGPDFSANKLRRMPHTMPYFQVYHQQEAVFAPVRESVGWGGKPIYNLAYPLYRDGRLIGHVWASRKAEDIHALAQNRLKHIMVTSLIIYLAILVLIHITFRRLALELRTFADLAVRDAEPDNEILPELQPVLDKIRNHQWQIRMCTVSQFAASVVHEVRNPITSIRGFAQLMLASEKDAQKKEYLSVMINEMNTVNHIISAFLRFTKPALPECKAVSASEVIEDLENLVGAQCLQSRVRFRALSEESNLKLVCDANQLKQVLLNLVQNALQAMDGREGSELSVYFTRQKTMAQIDVVDNGPGVCPEDIHKLFEPFFTTKGAGTGLGLALCKQLLEQQGGSITVRSDPGQGCVFTILLPLAGQEYKEAI